MSRVSRALRVLTLAGTAVAGLIGTHLLDYVLVIPDHAARHGLLAATGHGYLGMAVGLAFAAAIMAGASSVVLGLRHGSRGFAAPLAFGQVALRLVLLQSAGFLLLELGERLATGVPAHHLYDPVVIVGTLLQALAAVTGATILVALARGGELVGRALSAAPVFARESSSFDPPPIDLFPVVRHLSRTGPIRAPPALLASRT